MKLFQARISFHATTHLSAEETAPILEGQVFAVEESWNLPEAYDVDNYLDRISDYWIPLST